MTSADLTTEKALAPGRKPTVPRKSRDELKALAEDICAGRIFGTWMVPEHEDILTPFAMLQLAGAPFDDMENLGAVYEYLCAAGPLSVNGLPSFLTYRVLHKDDLSIVHNFATELRTQFWRSTDPLHGGDDRR